MIDGDNRARPYRSELRQQQAAETRRRVVEAAVGLFSQQGYQATTFTQIAKAAGVSVETVQKHGPKAALLQAAVELTSFGVEGETDFFATEVGRPMVEVGDPGELADLIAHAILAINAPSAGLWMTVVGAARGDEELGAFQRHMLGLVRMQVERAFQWVDGHGWLRHDVPFGELVEAFLVLTSVETYVRYVEVDGRSADEYEAFLARMMRETIVVVSQRPGEAEQRDRGGSGPTRRSR